MATYPAVWSVLQVATGALSDHLGRKWLIVIGMWVQAAGILLVITAPSLVRAQSETFLLWIMGSVLLGLGTALVYPTLLAAIGDVVHPAWRASAVGVYRLWRDLGYAIGALLAGVIADFFGLAWAIVVVAILTLYFRCNSGAKNEGTKRTPDRVIFSSPQMIKLDLLTRKGERSCRDQELSFSHVSYVFLRFVLVLPQLFWHRRTSLWFQRRLRQEITAIDCRSSGTTSGSAKSDLQSHARPNVNRATAPPTEHYRWRQPPNGHGSRSTRRPAKREASNTARDKRDRGISRTNGGSKWTT